MTDIASSLSDLDERTIATTELKAAEDKLQSLCATHAATFVAVERRGSNLTTSLKQLLHALDSALPLVKESKGCLELDSEGGKEDTLSSLAEKHRLRRRTLLQHSSLLELLELPSLMDACVRGHLYEEGLSIASFANTLERRHLNVADAENDTKNLIVDNVVNDVRKREGDLRRDLLNRLRSDVSMPQCLEIVTALRRLNGVELERKSMQHQKHSGDLEKIHDNMEWRLQVNFLEARDVWLEGNTSILNNSTLSLPNKGKRGASATKGGTGKILDGIDLYRTRCFEIATQFLAIFHSPSSGSSKTAGIHASQLLSMWTSRRIDAFLQDHLALKCLPMISDTATLRDALESVTFFATSMGRVGADFSPLLQTIFEPCLISIVTSHWSDGVNVLDNALRICRDTGIASPLYSNRDVTLSNENETSEGQNDHNAFGHRSKTPAPPRQLLSFPPLARFVNSFLIGLNELRRCLMTSAFPKLRSYFRDEFLEKVRQILVQNERAVLTPGFLTMKGADAGKLRSLAVELKEEFEGCVEPYLSGALEVSLGSFDNIETTEKKEIIQEIDEEKEEDVKVEVDEDEGNEAEEGQEGNEENEEETNIDNDTTVENEEETKVDNDPTVENDNVEESEENGEEAKIDKNNEEEN